MMLGGFSDVWQRSIMDCSISGHLTSCAFLDGARNHRLHIPPDPGEKAVAYGPVSEQYKSLQYIAP